LQQWRATLLRQLYPRESIINAVTNNERKRALNLTRKITQNAIDSVCKELAAKFQEEASLLLDGDPASIAHDLTAILRVAASISMDLWTQKRRFELYPFHKLPSSKYGKCGGMIEAHPLHNGQLDDEPQALHNKPILLVAHPAFLAYGNNSGTDYSVSRVLKKAVVWMGFDT